MIRGGLIGAGLLAALAAGCQGSGGTPLILSQTPPTVQAAYTADHSGTTIQSITRQTTGGQDLYTFKYLAADGSKHDLVYNGAGNEIDKH
jgi:hypothetical protein